MADAIIPTEITCRICKATKSLEEFGKGRGRYGRRSACKACRRAECQGWREKNPEYRMAYYEANKGKELSSREAKDKKREYYKKNAERIKAQSLKWAKDNPGEATARVMRRHAAKIKATPAWADHDQILEFYLVAQAKTKETGVMWHVDHVVPLQSKLVCGLHVQNNLSVILASENIAKSNQIWPDMP